MNRKISSLQASAILINMIVPCAILLGPSFVIQLTKRDVWLTMLLATGFVLVLAVAIGLLCRSPEGGSALARLQGRFDAWPVKLLGMLLCFYYLMMASTIVRQYASYVRGQMMMKTPLFVIGLLIAVVSVYMASRGAEALGRIHFIIFAVYVTFVVMNLCILSPQYQMNNFMPPLETPPLRHMVASLMPAGWLANIASVLLLLPYIKKPEAGMKIAVGATIGAGVMLTLITSVAVAVFGANVMEYIGYPAFSALATVDIGQFLERMDVLLLTAWMASMFGAVSVFMFFMLQLLRETLGLREGAGVSGSLALLVTATAVYTWPSDSAVAHFNNGVLPILQLCGTVLIAAIAAAFLFAAQRTRRRKQ